MNGLNYTTCYDAYGDELGCTMGFNTLVVTHGYAQDNPACVRYTVVDRLGVTRSYELGEWNGEAAGLCWQEVD